MRPGRSERARSDGVPRLEPSSAAESEPSETPDDGYAGDAVGGPEEGAREARQGTADGGDRPAPLAEGDSEEGAVAEVEMSLEHGGEADAGGEMRMRRQRDGGDGGRSSVVATATEEDDPEPRRRLSGEKGCMVSGANVCEAARRLGEPTAEG
jgi:hypothetical protein